MAGRIIQTEADIAEGAAALVAGCAHMRAVHALTGPPPLRRRPAGFEGLARIVVGQQLSVASAIAIWRRAEAAVRPFEPWRLLAVDEGVLREAGLSKGKIATLRAAAEACVAGALDLDRLGRAPDEDAIRAALTGVKGIGPWTADIYALFCLGRADAWAPGDLALRHAAGQAVGLGKVPGADEMVMLAEPWRPWRSVAARLLWAYYALRKAGSGGAPA